MLWHVESLSIGIPDRAACEYIGRLPAHTALTVQSFPLDVSLLPPLPTPHFTSLHDFTFEPDTISPVHLALSLWKCPATSEMDIFYSALKAACAHTSLLSLKLDYDEGLDFPPNGGEAAFITIHSIQTLFCFQTLTSLSVLSQARYDFNNAAIADLARAWPHLTNLMLSSRDERRPRTTLECLGPLAQFCPDICRRCNP
ncbi:hypothetical protein DFH09DRAFT_1316693 [Mycena vulgaris]|nr:hypothetical protein DFH09DRAFT_1316693 [Mycena vulgaris]